MLITGYTINIKTGDHGSILKYQSYHSGLNFKEIMLPNETLSSTQKILQLSRFGISVTSKLAPEIVDYLDAQKSASKVYLIQAYLVPNTGWFKYKIVGFALGSKIILPSGCDLCFKRDIPEAQSELVKAITQKGKFEVWVYAIKRIKKYKIVLFTIGVFLCGSLLEILNVPNFIFHLFSNSTCGKTSAFIIALSFIGRPTKDGLLTGWNTSITGVEGRANAFNSMVFVCDDSAQSPNEKTVSSIIYMLANGRGKERGTPDGSSKPSCTFHGPAASNGEKTLSNSSALMGEMVRCLESCREIFPGVTNEFIDEVINDVSHNYGFAYEKYIQYLVENVNDESKLSEIRNQFDSILESLSKNERCKFLKRTLPSFAVIKLALIIITQIIPELEISQSEIDDCIEAVIEEQRNKLKPEANIDKRALAYVWEQILADQRRFTNDDVERWGAKVTRRQADDSESTEGYGLIPSKLEKILKEGGYQFRSCVHYFKSNGWVWLNNDQLWTFKIDGHSIRGYVFDIKKAEDAGIICSEIKEENDDVKFPGYKNVVQNDNISEEGQTCLSLHRKVGGN